MFSILEKLYKVQEKDISTRTENYIPDKYELEYKCWDVVVKKIMKEISEEVVQVGKKTYMREVVDGCFDGNVYGKEYFQELFSNKEIHGNKVDNSLQENEKNPHEKEHYLENGNEKYSTSFVGKNYNVDEMGVTKVVEVNMDIENNGSWWNWHVTEC